MYTQIKETKPQHDIVQTSIFLTQCTLLHKWIFLEILLVKDSCRYIHLIGSAQLLDGRKKCFVHALLDRSASSGAERCLFWCMLFVILGCQATTFFWYFIILLRGVRWNFVNTLQCIKLSFAITISIPGTAALARFSLPGGDTKPTHECRYAALDDIRICTLAALGLQVH